MTNIKKYYWVKKRKPIQSLQTHSGVFSLAQKPSSVAFQKPTNSLAFTKPLLGFSYIHPTKKIQTRFSMVVTDQKRRGQFEKSEIENKVLRSLCVFPKFRRLQLVNSIRKKTAHRQGTLTRVRNRCVLTGRSSILGHTGLSRITFRKHAGMGKIPGLKKI